MTDEGGNLLQWTSENGAWMKYRFAKWVVGALRASMSVSVGYRWHRHVHMYVWSSTHEGGNDKRIYPQTVSYFSLHSHTGKYSERLY